MTHSWHPAQRGPTACRSGLEQLLLPRVWNNVSNGMLLLFLPSGFTAELLNADALRGSIYFLSLPQVPQRDVTFSQRDCTMSALTLLLFATFQLFCYVFHQKRRPVSDE